MITVNDVPYDFVNDQLLLMMKASRAGTWDAPFKDQVERSFRVWCQEKFRCTFTRKGGGYQAHFSNDSDAVVFKLTHVCAK